MVNAVNPRDLRHVSGALHGQPASRPVETLGDPHLYAERSMRD